nr:MAG TPA: hypothetical protein [Caudoviricetes sp.]
MFSALQDGIDVANLCEHNVQEVSALLSDSASTLVILKLALSSTSSPLMLIWLVFMPVRMT